MAQIDTTHTFVPGELVDAASMNNIVDQAAALAGLITDQGTAVAATGSDQVLINRAGTLKRANVSTLPTGVTSVGMTCNPVSVFGSPGPVITGTGTLSVSLDDQFPNKVLAGPASGTTAVTPSFRLLNSADTSFPTFNVLSATINWSFGNVFEKTLTVNTTFNFSNVKDGQTIRVRVKQSSAGNLTAAWDPGALTLVWCDGVTPTLTTAHNGVGIFVFTAITVVIGGTPTVIIHGFMEQTPQSAIVNLTPADTVFAQTLGAGETTMDLTLANYWIKQLAGGAGTITLKLNGGIAGQEITVYLFQGAAPAQTLVTWDTDDTGPSAGVRWPGGTDPVMTHGTVGASDVYHFVCVGTGSGLYLGTFDQDFKP